MLLGTRRPLLSAMLTGAYSFRGLGGSTVSTIISGPQALNKFGPTTINLSGLSTFTGPLYIYEGTLAISGAGSIGAGTYTGNIYLLGNSVLSEITTAAQSFNGIISGTGSIQKNSTSNTLNLNGTNTFTGGTYILAGTVNSTNNSGFGGSTGMIYLGLQGSSSAATILLNGCSAMPTPVTVYGGTGTRWLGETTGSSSVWTGAITLSGSPTLTLRTTGGNVTFTGGITGTGNVQCQADTGRGNPTAVSGGALNNTGTVSNISPQTGNFTVSSAIGANVTGIIQNSSTCKSVYSGASTGFVGTITVTLGTLEIDASFASAGTTTVTGTLQGTGTVGAVTVNNTTAATIQGGTATTTPGTLTTGNLTLSGSNSVLAVPSNGTTTLSQVSVNGTCALGGCKVNLLNTCSAGTYTLIAATGTMSGTLPVIGTNSSGRTPTFTQVSNNLQVTLV